MSPTGSSHQSAQSRKTLIRRLVPLAILLIGILVARILASGPPTPKNAATPAAPTQQAVYRLITPQQLPVVISSYGKLETRRTLELAAETSGKVISSSDSYRVGSSIAANQTLLRLDDIDAATELARARARLAEAEEQLASELGRARQAKREWRDLGSAEANALFLREPQVLRTESAVAAAKAELKLAQRNIERLDIRAPFDAIIQNISADLGDYVNKGSVVASLLDTSTLEVHLPLSPRQFRELNYSPQDFAQGIPIQLHRDTDSLNATIKRTAGVVDPDTRLYTLIADIDPNADTSQWRIGEFLRAEIPSTTTRPMLAVPQEAIYEQRFLRVATPQNALHIIPINISHTDNSTVFVTAKTGSFEKPLRVIISGLAVNTEGTLLQAISDTPSTDTAEALPIKPTSSALTSSTSEMEH